MALMKISHLVPIQTTGRHHLLLIIIWTLSYDCEYQTVLNIRLVFLAQNEGLWVFLFSFFVFWGGFLWFWLRFFGGFSGFFSVDVEDNFVNTWNHILVWVGRDLKR